MNSSQHVCHRDTLPTLRGRIWPASNPRGVVVVRTPYDVRTHLDLAQMWVNRNYICLVQDVRGRYSSDGNWEPYQHERVDGHDTVTQVHRDFPRLPVVLYGASYAGHTALEAAFAEPISALIVAVPALGLAETCRDAHGRPQVRDRIGWWHQHGLSATSQPALDAATLLARCREVEQKGTRQAARNWGWSPQSLNQWDRMWRSEKLNFASHYSGLSTPLLVINGEHDFFTDHTLHLADSWPASSRHLTGPWGHSLQPDTGADAVALREAGGLALQLDDWLHSRLPSRRSYLRFSSQSRAWIHERNCNR